MEEEGFVSCNSAFERLDAIEHLICSTAAQRISHTQRALMIRPTMTKKLFLRQPSEPANADDLVIARDFMGTLEAHCVGSEGVATTTPLKQFTMR